MSSGEEPAFRSCILQYSLALAAVSLLVSILTDSQKFPSADSTESDNDAYIYLYFCTF